MSNVVYIATSLDGYIADKNGGLDWLESVPNPDNLDFGYANFIDTIDALVMGRKTFETVCGFGGQWPYPKPVFVLSRTLTTVPEELQNKVEIVSGSLAEVIKRIRQKGYLELYIDGGVTIQSFLQEDLIDEMTITHIPILLGGGASLFGDLPEHMEFEHVSTEVLLGEMVQSRYRRKRNI